jgi:adenylate kinase family enzyme
MKLLIFGNSGSGKSTLARDYARREELAHLDLDTIVWEPGKIASPRPAADVLASLNDFIARNERWVIEGCYGELVQAAAAHCTQLIFLNPGREACLANNLRRAWEPHKYASKEAQDAMLDNLQQWVSTYYERDDAWSYRAHRAIFDTHLGAKFEENSEVPCHV